MNYKNLLLVTLLLAISHCCLFSQIVNIEKKRGSVADSVFWNGDIRLGAALIQNSKRIINVHSVLRIDHVRYRHSFMSLSNYRLGRVDKEDFLNSGFQHFRYNYRMSKRWTWEAFTQLQYDEQIALEMRWLLGSGPRVALILQEKNQAYLGALYMYEYNEEKTLDDDIRIIRDHRLSTYLNLHFQPLEQLSINSTTYYQPVINDLVDLRLSTETSLEMKITERLVYNTVFTLVYDTDPPPNITKTIYSFRNGLRLTF
ncbi:MAG: DUF481 domain-containing protein [Saprospiraceae bacterium]